MRRFLLVIAALLLSAPLLIANRARAADTREFLDEVEAYDVRTNTWSEAAPLPTPGRPGAAVAAPDGRIYLLGIEGSATTYAYTPATNSWTTLAPNPAPRSSFAAALGGDGRIYIIGGKTATYTYVNTVEAYDPRTNTWQAVASMPTARALLAAATGPDGRIYAMGGLWQNGQFLGDRAYATVEVYTPATNTWATTASMPQAVVGPVATTARDGRIYVLGGNGGTSMAVYDPPTNHWSSGPGLLTAGASAVVAGPDGRLYALGGTYQTFMLGGIHGDIDEYQTHRAIDQAVTPGAAPWTAIAPMPTPRNQTVAATGADGRIYVFGGANAYLSSEAPPSPTAAPAPASPRQPDRGWIMGTVTLQGTTTPLSGATILVEGTPLRRGPLPTGSYQFPALSVTDGADGGPTYTVQIVPPPGYTVVGPATQTVTVQPDHGVRADFVLQRTSCQFVLGFRALHDAIPGIVGACLDDEAHSPENGDALQHTANGLLVWRKSDNFTAFTDGYRTWVNGPHGVQERLNGQRFAWEANPGGLPVSQ